MECEPRLKFDEKPMLQEADEQEHAKPVKITVSMIAKRNLRHAPSETTEAMVQKLLKLTHVRLDRENIGEVDHMEVLGPVTNLYLQQNCLRNIDNLESLMDLRFLVLSGNQIETVENLLSLDKLQFLDLSENQIRNLDAEEFPKSLMILNLAGNPCCQQTDHRLKLIKSLPNLKQLDGRSVTNTERRDAGQEVTSSGSEDDQSDDNDESYHKSLDDLLHLSASLISQSQQRTQQYKAMHDDKVTVIDDVRTQSRQAMSTPELITPR